MFYKLPEVARRELVLNAYEIEESKRPASLNVVALEVRAETKLSKRWLKQLGYEDE